MMILSVVMIGGVLLGASAIVGTLLVYQIRQSNNAIDSAKAFFAADAGIEWQSYSYFKDPTISQLVFSGGVSAVPSISFLPDGSARIRSQGFAGHLVRALETVFGTSPSVFFYCGTDGQLGNCNIASGNSIDIFWSSLNADSCVASEIDSPNSTWIDSPSKIASSVTSTESVTVPQVGNYNLALSCSGNNGVTTSTLSITK